MNADYTKTVIIEELQKLPLSSLCLALTYARYIQRFGIDVTNTMNSATKYSEELDRAYIKGRLDERTRASQNVNN